MIASRKEKNGSTMFHYVFVASCYHDRVNTIAHLQHGTIEQYVREYNHCPKYGVLSVPLINSALLLEHVTAGGLHTG